MASWWHNSPGYISTDAEQIVLEISAASTLIPKMSHLSVVVHQDTYFGTIARINQKKLVNRQKL